MGNRKDRRRAHRALQRMNTMSGSDSIKPIQQAKTAVDPQQTADGKTPETTGNSPLGPKIEPSQTKKNKTEHSKPDQTPAWKIVFEVSAIIVGCYVAWIYHGQLSVMQGQLTEMQGSSKRSDEQFQVDQRAWVSVSEVTCPPSLVQG